MIVHGCIETHPKGCKWWMMDYCNGVQGFINYTLYNLRNISGGCIRCPCKRYKKKKFIDPDVVTMHLLQKKVHGEIHMLVCTQRAICSSWCHSIEDGWVNF
jgi:hypothetical protein